MIYHSGYHVQRGHGLGNFFSGLFKTIVPIASSFLRSNTGQTLKKIALSTAVDAAKDIISGKNVKDTAKTNLAKAKSQISEVVKRKLDEINPQQTGSRLQKRSKRNQNIDSEFDLFNE